MLTEGQSLPSQKNELVDKYFEGQVCGFHVGHFPKGHMPTGTSSSELILARLILNEDFERWFGEEKTYEIRYSEGFEPYIIMKRVLIPW